MAEESVSIRCDKDTKFKLQILAAHYSVPDQEALKKAVERHFRELLPEIMTKLQQGL